MTTSNIHSTTKMVRQFPDFTLRTKLIVAFLLVALLPMSLQAYLNNRTTQELVINNANRALLGAASQTAGAIDDFIKTNLSSVRVEARLPFWSKYLALPAEQRRGSEIETEAVNTLRDLSRKSQAFASAYVPSYALLDGQGRNLIDTQTGGLGLDESGELYFQIPLQTGQAYVSPVQFSQTTKAANLYFSSPVRDATGEIIGLLRVRYTAAILQQQAIQHTGLAGEQSFAILLDENHLRLVDTEQPELIFKSVTPLGPARVAELQRVKRLPDRPAPELSTNLPEFEQGLTDAIPQPNFTAIAHPNQEVEQVAVVPLKTQPWLVAFVQPRSVFLVPVSAQTRTTLLLVGAGIVAMIVAAISVAQLLTRPIVRLTTIAQKVAGGDLTVQARLESNDEIGLLAATFNGMTSQLSELIDSLEQRVANRTQRLELVATLSERLTAILDLDTLLMEMVNQVKEAFGYYHVQVYLLDEQRQQLVMAAGVGEAGAQMKAAGHHIFLHTPTSLVARAARTGEVVQVDNVREAADWLPNPLLPETYSEMAVPIILEGQVVGVLDVQEDERAGLDEGDANLLRSLASQVAVAMRNARLFAKVETALVQARAAQEKYAEQAWQQRKGQVQKLEHLHIRSVAAPALAETTLAQAKQLALAQNRPALVTLAGIETDSTSIVAPVTLSGKTIGVLQAHRLDSTGGAGAETRAWTDEDLAVVETVLDQVAQAAENLRLFEETRERAGRERIVREITDKLRQAPTLNILAKMAAEELGQVLGVSHSLVKLGIPEEQQFLDPTISPQPQNGGH